MIQVHKAERRKAKLRLALTGTSGSGKTYTSLLVARGLVGQSGKILMVDTENGSGELYADCTEYDIAPITAPYETEKYIEAIHFAEENGYDVIILDSISHAWVGQGGLIEQKDSASLRTGNSFTAWASISPKHQKFIDAMLSSKIHLIATMRSKTEYALVADKDGKTRPEKHSLAPVQRDGMDYEFTIVFDLDSHHFAEASKDRSGIFDGQIFTPSIETGKQLADWLDKGIEVAPIREAVKKAVVPPVKSTPEPVKQKPSRSYGKIEVDHIKDTYFANGWKASVFDEAEYEKGVLWDAELIDADYKMRANAGKQTKPTPEKPARKIVHCDKCGAEITPDEAKASMEANAGGIFCKKCLKETQAETEHKLAPFCVDCGNHRVLPKEETMSKNMFGVALCPSCYKARLMASEQSKKQPKQEPEPVKAKPKYTCSKCGAEMTAKEWSTQSMFMTPPMCCKCMDEVEGQEQ